MNAMIIDVSEWIWIIENNLANEIGALALIHENLILDT